MRARERRRRAAGACGAARAAALTLRPLPSGDAGKSPGHTRAASVGAAELRGRCGQPAPPRGAPPRPSPPSSDAAPAPPPPRLAPREGRRPARPGPGPPPERRDPPFLSFIFFFIFPPFKFWSVAAVLGPRKEGTRRPSSLRHPLPASPWAGLREMSRAGGPASRSRRRSAHGRPRSAAGQAGGPGCGTLVMRGETHCTVR